jgi:hypothetical protein
MEIKLAIANPADVETECLVAFALDHGDKQKPDPKVASKDATLEKAAADLIDHFRRNYWKAF